MNDAMVINSPSVLLDNVRSRKKEALELAKGKLNNFKLDLLKDAMDSRNISYDKSITDYVKMQESLKSTLNSSDYSNILEICNELDKELDKVLTDLLNGSSNAFSKFINEKYETLIRPIGKSVVNGMAVSTVINLAPTVETKIAAMAIASGVSVYKLVKSDKFKSVASKNYELSKILNELETTKDNSGKIIDTRFNDSIQTDIKEFLSSKNIKYKDTGYLSLREVMYSLDTENKLQLVNIINNKIGNVINVEDRVSKYDDKQELQLLLMRLIQLTWLVLLTHLLQNT